MPIILHTENFDGVTAPALPVDWTANAGIISTVNAAKSSPNALTNTNNGAVQVAYYGTTDNNNGSVRVNFSAFFGGIPGANQSPSVLARCTIAPSPWSGATCYYLRLDLGAGGTGLGLLKRVAGTSTSLGSPILAASFSISIWYYLQIVCQVSAISAYCQRGSDSQWLQTNGTWGASQVACLAATDTAIAGANGYAGIALFQQTTSQILFVDDFELDSTDNYPVGYHRAPNTLIRM